ncbi:hypothetical protein N4G70_34260 [Streptomyces sp. ASQP_92]|uniref:hypothetical protein n=1 Tax=Streptomyces sp. ASQP_92 TaxID=2979116 RepID=UPI0021C191CF|nr:hypothetical protein [Streptomyces sp. ASQP_92]MCT9093883.1 hypothetical protein [Streptomyces sp. ASQP_92]
MTTIKVRGPLKIGTDTLRCPGRGERDTPRELTLMSNGKTVTATCGQKHKGEDGGRRAQCFFPVEQLTAANLGILGQGKPGRFRLTLTDGTKVEGILAAVGGAAANSTAARAAAAADAKSGKTAQAGPAKPAGRATGGAMTAAFGALAAVAGAAGQAAGAAGQIAAAGASAVESASSLGREGIGVARDGIREAGAYGERRHERKMRAADGDGAED